MTKNTNFQSTDAHDMKKLSIPAQHRIPFSYCLPHLTRKIDSELNQAIIRDGEKFIEYSRQVYSYVLSNLLPSCLQKRVFY
jgi:hypothetical protein